MSRAVAIREVGGFLLPIDEKGEVAAHPCAKCGHFSALFRNSGGVTLCIECPRQVVQVSAAEVAEMMR